MLQIALAQHLPAGFAAQQLATGNAACGQLLQQLLPLLRAGRVRMLKIAVQALQRIAVADRRRLIRPRRVAPGVRYEHLLQVHHIGRHLVVTLWVGAALAADKHHREAHIRQPQQHLVYPAGDATAHVRPGSFQQQTDVCLWCAHNQYPTVAAKGGLACNAGGIRCSCTTTSR